MVSDLSKSFKIFSHDNCMVGGLTNLSDTYKALHFFQLPNIPSLKLSSTNIIVWGWGKKFPHKNVQIYTTVGRCKQVQNQLGGHDKTTTIELVLAHK
jgi:hypothetical protein